MRILMAVHVGESMGHLARALSVAHELNKHGSEIHIATSPRARAVLAHTDVVHTFWPIRWDWSHNSITVPPTSRYTDSLIATNTDLSQVLRQVRPEVVAGFPGVFTHQLARTRGIAHVSFLHGPYVSPLATLNNPTELETTVLNFATELMTGGTWDSLFDSLSKALNLSPTSYQTFLQTEAILVAQPGLGISQNNCVEIDFISASLGNPIRLPMDLQDACYVTFGTGNKGDITPIVDACAECFSRVIVTTGRGQALPNRRNVFARNLIPSAQLAGRVDLTVTHGGIGTVGTFAAKGTRLLIIPTEIDQATMAVHAARHGWAAQYGLLGWGKHPRLGRRLPPLEKEGLRRAISSALQLRPQDLPGDAGASQAASWISQLVGDVRGQVRTGTGPEALAEPTASTAASN